MSATQLEEVEITKEQIEDMKAAYKNAFGRDGEFRFEEHYIDVVEIDGLAALTRGKAPVEKESITGTYTIEQEFWFVEGVQTYPATRWEPEDVDYVPISEHTSLCDALISAFNVVVGHAVNAHFEAKAMEEYAKECQENPWPA